MLDNRKIADLPSLLEVTPERGFLPVEDPILRLPDVYDSWEEVARELPKLLAAGRLRPALDRLGVLDIDGLPKEEHYHRAMLLLSYFGHAYVWGETEPAKRLPAGVAIPWCQVAHRLGRPPILSYASYALYNWRRLDKAGPIALGNIVLCQNFLGGVDEEWFVVVHVAIEATASAALESLERAQRFALEDRPQDVADALRESAQVMRQMQATLDRMPEHCDPYIYFHRVRPYLYGWKDQPALPAGLNYDGVDADDQPRKFRGETGAQSSIIPALDAALGIEHAPDPLRSYLMEMREYMPPSHRKYVEALERGPSLRPYVLAHGADCPGLRSEFNRCVTCVERFRARHLEYAARYIQQQNLHGRSNPNDVGTGGTPFMAYLKKHREETAASLVS